MSDWPCWACHRPIPGDWYHYLHIVQKKKGDWLSEGSSTQVALCIDCAERVSHTLTDIQDRAASMAPAAEAQDERGESGED